MACEVAAIGGASYRRLRLIGRQGSDAVPTLAVLIKVTQQTCPRILADYLRTAEPQTPSDAKILRTPWCAGGAVLLTCANAQSHTLKRNSTTSPSAMT